MNAALPVSVIDPKESLRERLRDKLFGSALDDSDAALLRLQLFTSAEAAQTLDLPTFAGGFKIPYFDLLGRPTKFYRFRYLEDTRRGFEKITQPKSMRYGQPAGTLNEVYLAPYTDWASISQDVAVPLIVTEGELKAACATRYGYPTLGLGGVWCFMSKKQELPLLPGLAQFNWAERTVYIVFDSDAATNPDIVRAEGVLAQRLIEAGACVYLGRLPAHDEVSKVGLDDFIVIYGAEALAPVLQSATEFSASRALHGLNQRVVYVRDPGFVWDHELQQKLPPQSFTGHAFANVPHWETSVSKTGVVALRKVQAASAWLQWENRAEVRGVTYEPGKPKITADGLLNTWLGWGIEQPRAGSVAVWKELLDHLFGRCAEERRWFEAWAAYPLQHPGFKLNTAVLIWGPEHGTGKTLMGSMLMRIYGKNATELKDKDLDDGRFQWAENKQFALADDITARGDLRFMRQLMTMVTQKWIRLDPKFIPSYSIRDTINYYITSNDPDALKLDDQDRRFFIHEVAAGKLEAALRRRALAARNSDEAIAALWHYLLALDIEWFDITEPAMMTRGKEQMQSMNKSELGAWVKDLKDNTAVVLAKAGLTGDLFTAKELFALYDPLGTKSATASTMGRELKRAGFTNPGTGTRLRIKDGSLIAVFALRNGQHWVHKATWRQACDHYMEHHPKLDGKNKW